MRCTGWRRRRRAVAAGRQVLWRRGEAALCMASASLSACTVGVAVDAVGERVEVTVTVSVRL